MVKSDSKLLNSLSWVHIILQVNNSAKKIDLPDPSELFTKVGVSSGCLLPFQ